MITDQKTTREMAYRSASGYIALTVSIVLPVIGFIFLVRGIVIPLIIITPIELLVLLGFYMLQPNQAAVLTLFGHYVGTDRNGGLRWANPFYRKTKISLRAQNIISEKLKVNDKRGNPVEIAAAIVWRVRDTAQALFDVEDYYTFIRIQAEAAIRHVASAYAYDNEGESAHGEKPEITLRGGMDEVAASLVQELQARISRTGLVIEDAKLTHLAYAPEVASAMLRRQQAEAVLAARQKIVTGAVTMVEAALKQLSERNIIELDDERKAAMVSNLLVVLCADNEAQPVINTGTLYS
jgi:regulator of protease activity HflC (stomatin/prohibitin superfamily)